MLDEYLVVLGDQQASNRIARQVFYYRRSLAPKIIADLRLRALEHPRDSRALDPMCRIDFIEMAVGADAIFYFIGVARLTSE